MATGRVMTGMTIGRLAQASGVHVEAIRYNQRRTLLEAPRRPADGVRRYGKEAVARLRVIKRAQDIGYTLEEVRELLRLQRRPACRASGSARTCPIIDSLAAPDH